MGTLPAPPRAFHTWYLDSAAAVRKRDGHAVSVWSAAGGHTRWVEAAVIPAPPGGRSESGSLSARSADLFRSAILCRYGAPRRVVTDDGPEFAGHFAALMASLGVEHRTVSPGAGNTLRSHAGIAPVERWHRALWDRLAFLAPQKVTEWRPIVAAAAAAYNTARSSAAGASPYELCTSGTV